jgi:hypothetical protein
MMNCKLQQIQNLNISMPLNFESGESGESVLQPAFEVLYSLQIQLSITKLAFHPAGQGAEGGAPIPVGFGEGYFQDCTVSLTSVQFFRTRIVQPGPARNLALVRVGLRSPGRAAVLVRPLADSV